MISHNPLNSRGLTDALAFIQLISDANEFKSRLEALKAINEEVIERTEELNSLIAKHEASKTASQIIDEAKQAAALLIEDATKYANASKDQADTLLARMNEQLRDQEHSLAAREVQLEEDARTNKTKNEELVIRERKLNAQLEEYNAQKRELDVQKEEFLSKLAKFTELMEQRVT